MNEGQAGLAAFVAFEITESLVFSAARSFHMKKVDAGQFAFDAGITAASLVATATSLLTHDFWGAVIAAGYIGFAIGERRRKPRRQPKAK